MLNHHSRFLKRTAVLLAAALTLSSLSACGRLFSSPAPGAVSDPPSGSGSSSSAQADSSSPDTAGAQEEQTPEEPVQASKGTQPPFVDLANPHAAAEGGTAHSYYDFSQPAPESEEVELSYFDDAAFVGDSRTDGFLIYSGIGRGKNLTSNGLSIFKLESKKALTIDGQSYTLLEALALEQYGKVYLSLGVNELGTYDDEGFYESYCSAIDRIRAIQPNAVIYIQGLIPLNEDMIAQTTGRTYLTNEHLRVYNDLMKKAAEEKQVVYLDLYSEFVDENGQLPAEASKDGVHLRSDWCKQWLAYLRTHTVDYDTLYPQGAPQPGAEGTLTETEGGAAQ